MTTEHSTISNQTLLGTYTVPADCSVIFVEDRVWIEGTVQGKGTVVSANPDNLNTVPEVFLRNNILYASNDGSDGLTVISQTHVLLPLVVPSVMEIHGVFIA